MDKVNANNTIRKVTFEIGEGNKIQNIIVLDRDEETGEFRANEDITLGEALWYIYEQCRGIDELVMYEEENDREMARHMAVAEFEFEKFVTGLYREAFQQSIFVDPFAGIKCTLALPVMRFLAKIKDMERKNRLIEYIQDRVIPVIRDWTLLFFFGKENMTQIKELIEEGRKKFLYDRQY